MIGRYQRERALWYPTMDDAKYGLRRSVHSPETERRHIHRSTEGRSCLRAPWAAVPDTRDVPSCQTSCAAVIRIAPYAHCTPLRTECQCCGREVHDMQKTNHTHTRDQGSVHEWRHGAQWLAAPLQYRSPLWKWVGCEIWAALPPPAHAITSGIEVAAGWKFVYRHRRDLPGNWVSSIWELGYHAGVHKWWGRIGADHYGTHCACRRSCAAYSCEALECKGTGTFDRSIHRSKTAYTRHGISTHTGVRSDARWRKSNG